MKRIIKNNLGKFLTGSFIFLIAFVFILFLTHRQIAISSPDTEIKKPTAHTDNIGWTNPAQAYDFPSVANDQTTQGNGTDMADADPAINFHTWATKSQVYTATVLKVNWRTNGAFSDDQFGIRYTNNGGANWIDLVALGIHNETTIQTSSVNLSANQNLTQVQVKVVTDRTKGPDGGTLYIYDIWAEGTYEPVVGVITAGTTGTQTASMDIPSTDQYVGGAFTLVRDSGSANVTQIIITETGTVNADLNLSNVRLYYETTAVCSYDGTEALFGAAASFNASAKATISGTMSVSTSRVCVYVVLDVGSGASDGETLEIEISNPSTEVTVSAGSVSPVTPIAIAGTTILQVSVVPPASWREDEDTPTSGVVKQTNIRLRIELANTGSEATDYDYLLEYAPKVGATCGDDESFIVVPVTASTEHFEIRDSTYITNGEPTTAQLTVPPCCSSFVPGRMVEDPSNSSGNLTLPFENYTEIEFVFQATTNAIDGSSYCFRVANAGTPLNEYPIYPELQIASP